MSPTSGWRCVALLDFVMRGLDHPAVQSRWHWRQYDVAVWDERCTNHRALADHYPEYRCIPAASSGEGRRADRRADGPSRIRYVSAMAGPELRELRRRAGLTQAEFARRLGVPASVLSAYENGRREPRADFYFRAARAAGFDVRLVRRLDDKTQGRRLVDVLELAERLPARHRPLGKARWASP